MLFEDIIDIENWLLESSFADRRTAEVMHELLRTIQAYPGYSRDARTLAIALKGGEIFKKIEFIEQAKERGFKLSGTLNSVNFQNEMLKYSLEALRNERDDDTSKMLSNERKVIDLIGIVNRELNSAIRFDKSVKFNSIPPVTLLNTGRLEIQLHFDEYSVAEFEGHDRNAKTRSVNMFGQNAIALSFDLGSPNKKFVMYRSGIQPINGSFVKQSDYSSTLPEIYHKYIGETNLIKLYRAANPYLPKYPFLERMIEMIVDGK